MRLTARSARARGRRRCRTPAPATPAAPQPPAVLTTMPGKRTRSAGSLSTPGADGGAASSKRPSSGSCRQGAGGRPAAVSVASGGASGSTERKRGRSAGAPQPEEVAAPRRQRTVSEAARGQGVGGRASASDRSALASPPASPPRAAPQQAARNSRASGAGGAKERPPWRPAGRSGSQQPARVPSAPQVREQQQQRASLGGSSPSLATRGAWAVTRLSRSNSAPQGGSAPAQPRPNRTAARGLRLLSLELDQTSLGECRI